MYLFQYKSINALIYNDIYQFLMFSHGYFVLNPIQMLICCLVGFCNLLIHKAISLMA
ncbi:hypothetical protein MIZ03_1982 [Rhodoferax lithotrophicus]|uniref:Uncharacterized protein n=1 Tax=Rhodoferax lithotrophicus TaxID=2798804 RepID=A0ABM7MLI6_9BURK|nr:hypothetical protein MIZ03_1982 [Rhodoferax sp. MIZ03]